MNDGAFSGFRKTTAQSGSAAPEMPPLGPMPTSPPPGAPPMSEPLPFTAPVVEDDASARLWRVTQTIADPAGHRDWVIEALADLDASDEAGELVLATVAMRNLGD